MPDSTKNFAVDAVNAPVPDVMTKADFENILEHLDYVSGLLRQLDQIATGGLLTTDGAGVAAARSLAWTADQGFSVTNADGAAGNPTISLGAKSTLLKHVLFDGAQTLSTSPGVIDNVTTPVTRLTATTTPTASLAAPSAGGIKIIVNESVDDNTLTITNYQAPSGGIAFQSGAALISKASLILWSNGTNWYPLAGKFLT
tara:strand:+ start:15185 stop:15784 length:600 start_codon:yes stop_codon:yes gene_type:complete